MKVFLEYVAMLHLHGPANGTTMDLPEGTTVTALLDRFRVSPAHQKVIVPFINNAKARPDTPLKDGDRLFLAMPVGGG